MITFLYHPLNRICLKIAAIVLDSLLTRPSFRYNPITNNEGRLVHSYILNFPWITLLDTLDHNHDLFATGITLKRNVKRE